MNWKGDIPLIVSCLIEVIEARGSGIIRIECGFIVAPPERGVFVPFIWEGNYVFHVLVVIYDVLRYLRRGGSCTILG